MIYAQEEVKRIQSVPLVIGQFLEAVDQNTGIVGSTTGNDICSRRGQENTECSPSHWSVP